jgi:hypothetical protein
VFISIYQCLSVDCFASKTMIRILRETHETPGDVARALALAGGHNRFGEANYRAVWGWSRLDWIGGKWEDHDPQTGGLLREVIELRREPKYLPHDRWHIERWMPPESYGSPESWHAATTEFVGGRNVAALGPYPSRGDYEHCFTLEGPGGEFVQLTPAAVNTTAAVTINLQFNVASTDAITPEMFLVELKQ